MTPSQTIGPFFNYALTVDAALGCIAGSGERIRVRLRLLDGDAAPVTDGMVEFWQADASGKYETDFTGFGRLETNQDGVCLFETIRPGRVGSQAAHINVMIFARGLLAHLSTRVYFSGDPAIAEDAVLALVPADRRVTMMAEADAVESGQWNLDIHLQGENETVFFDF